MNYSINLQEAWDGSVMEALKNDSLAEAIKILENNLNELNDKLITLSYNGEGINKKVYPVLVDNKTVSLCQEGVFDLQNHIAIEDTYTLWKFVESFYHIPVFYDEENDTPYIENKYVVNDNEMGYLLNHYGFKITTELTYRGGITSISYYRDIEVRTGNECISFSSIEDFSNKLPNIRIGKGIIRKPEFNNDFSELLKEEVNNDF